MLLSYSRLPTDVAILLSSYQLVWLFCYTVTICLTVLFQGYMLVWLFCHRVISWCEHPVTGFPVGVTILLQGHIFTGLQSDVAILLQGRIFTGLQSDVAIWLQVHHLVWTSCYRITRWFDFCWVNEWYALWQSRGWERKKHTLSQTRILRFSVGVTVVLQGICRCYCRVTGVPVDVTSRYRGTSWCDCRVIGLPVGVTAVLQGYQLVWLSCYRATSWCDCLLSVCVTIVVRGYKFVWLSVTCWSHCRATGIPIGVNVVTWLPAGVTVVLQGYQLMWMSFYRATGWCECRVSGLPAGVNVVL